MPIQLSSIPLSLWWRVGCISGASAVALGAFGAHALKYADTALSLLLHPTFADFIVRLVL